MEGKGARGQARGGYPEHWKNENCSSSEAIRPVMMLINGERNHAHKHSHHVVYFPEILAPGSCHYLSKNPVINLCLCLFTWPLLV